MKQTADQAAGTALPEISNPATLFDPAPYGFSHIAVVPAGHTLVFVAGQGGEEDKDGRLSPDFRAQVRQAFKNIALALQAKGLGMNNVARITTLVVDHDAEKHRVIIEESQKIWPGGNFPADTLIPVPRLAQDGMLVEIDAVATAGLSDGIK